MYKRKNKKKIIPIEGEIWKIIPGTNDRFQVSNMGRLKKDWFHATYKRHEVKLLKGHVTASGRVQIILRIAPKYNVICYLHDLVIKTFNDLTISFYIIHNDCNRQNNRLDNLKIVTRKESREFEKENCGRYLKRTRLQEYITPTGKVKLTRTMFSKSDIKKIRQRYHETKISQRQLAEEYGCHQTTISGIIQRKYNGKRSYLDPEPIRMKERYYKKKKKQELNDPKG